MAKAARVTRVVPDVEGLVGGRHGKMKSEQSLASAWLSQVSPSSSHHRRAVDSSTGGRQPTTRYLDTLGKWWGRYAQSERHLVITWQGTVISRAQSLFPHIPGVQVLPVPSCPDMRTLAGTSQFSSSGLSRSDQARGGGGLRGEAAGRVSATVSLLPAAPSLCT